MVATHRVSVSFLPPLPKIVQLSNNNRQGRRAHRDETEIIKRQVSTLRHIFSIYFQRAAVEIRFHRREWQAMHRAGRVIDEKKEGGRRRRRRSVSTPSMNRVCDPSGWETIPSPTIEFISRSNYWSLPATTDSYDPMCRFYGFNDHRPPQSSLLSLCFSLLFFFPPFFSFSFRERSRRA